MEKKLKSWQGWLLFGGTMAVVFVLGVLAASINERRAEIASVMNNKKVEITGIESVNEKFAPNYPREYETWTQTMDTSFQSKYNGNQMVDVLAARPEMVILWAGYAFSKDYSTPRGHMHAIDDMRHTLRVGAPMTPDEGPQPATCWTCKSPDVPRMMQAIGVDNFYKSKWAAMGTEIVNPIGCADCHEPENMNLHISRPALIEAFQRQGRDITKATQQEMRSLVCAQCHVEYYFKGDGKYLTFPWDKGFTVEDMEAYYDKEGFADYTHKLSRTPILKAQHPDYELSHARALLHFLARRDLVADMLTAYPGGLRVVLGNESDRPELSGSSIIITRYALEDGMTGTIGLIGPLRMDYATAIPRLEYYSSRVGKLLTELLNE